MKLFYFPAPGRAEVSRILLKLSGQPYEDVRFRPQEWKEKYKAMSPSGSSPWLELDDGTKLTQSLAINVWAAEKAGYMPTDAIARARTFEIIGSIDDAFAPFGATFSLPAGEKEAKRAELMQPGGGMAIKLAVIEKLLSSSNSTYYLSDDKPTLADFYVFNNVAMFFSGNMDGITKEMFDPYPTMVALKSKVAQYGPIKEYYATQEDRPSFKE